MATIIAYQISCRLNSIKASRDFRGGQPNPNPSPGNYAYDCYCCLVWSPGCNALLIRFLISALLLFACLYRTFPHLSFFLHFFLTYLLPYLSFHLRIDPRKLRLWSLVLHVQCCMFRSPHTEQFDWRTLTGRMCHCYYTYGAAVVIVELDCLTGQYTVLTRSTAGFSWWDAWGLLLTLYVSVHLYTRFIIHTVHHTIKTHGPAATGWH